MSTKGLEIYDSLSRPPPEALKTITGGRLNGKTDIKPQWRYRAMTECFGLCGVGWKYTIDRQWTERGASDEVLAFVNISLFVKSGDGWSDPIPGTGGSMLVEKEKAGLHNSDEAFKMATTDALSVALKMIGVAASIYMGEWDGRKYADRECNNSPEDRQPAKPAARGPADDSRITFIKDILGHLCPTQEEYNALRQEIWDKHDGNLDAILKDLEGRELAASGRKS